MNTLSKGALAALASLGFHVGTGLILHSMANESLKRPRGRALQIAVVNKPKPPPPKPPEPTKPKPAPPKPKHVTVVVTKTPAPPPPIDAPPPPVVEAKTNTPPPPVLLPGITLESTSSGGSFAVATGNTLAGDPGQLGRDPKDVAPAHPYKAERYVAAAQVNELPDVLNKGEVDLKKYYPAEARKKEFEGQVVLRLLIDEDGTVVKVEVISDPGEGLGAAAVKAIHEFRFSPAKVNGRGVATTVPFKISFVLD